MELLNKDKANNIPVVKSLIKALEILRQIDSGEVSSLSQLSTSTSIPRPTVHRIVRTLRSEGIINIDNGVYSYNGLSDNKHNAGNQYQYMEIADLISLYTKSTVIVERRDELLMNVVYIKNDTIAPNYIKDKLLSTYICDTKPGMFLLSNDESCIFTFNELSDLVSKSNRHKNINIFLEEVECLSNTDNIKSINSSNGDIIKTLVTFTLAGTIYLFTIYIKNKNELSESVKFIKDMKSILKA